MTLGQLYLRLRQSWNPGKKMLALWLKQKSLLEKVAQAELKTTGTIVSFTTFSTRIHKVKYVLLSILQGTVIPEFITLYVCEKTYKEILALHDGFITTLIERRYLILKIVPDVRSYKKLVYALQDFPEKNIVTCDDDVIYPAYWLQTIYQKHQEYRNEKYIVAHRAHLVSTSNNRIAPYNDWKKEVTQENIPAPSKLLFPTGTGGVLYPSKSMPKTTWDIDLFSKYASTNDDIWFWFCAQLMNRQYVLTDVSYQKKKMPEIPNYSTPNLFQINVNENANDQQLKNCVALFKEEFGFEVQEENDKIQFAKN
ncbi:MAG: hypothetical protein AAGG68_13965 [Bacteroidota bacterium]